MADGRPSALPLVHVPPVVPVVSPLPLIAPQGPKIPLAVPGEDQYHF